MTFLMHVLLYVLFHSPFLIRTVCIEPESCLEMVERFSNEIEWKWFGAIWFSVISGYEIVIIVGFVVVSCEWQRVTNFVLKSFTHNVTIVSCLFQWSVIDRTKVNDNVEYFQISKLFRGQCLIMVMRENRRVTTREQYKWIKAAEAAKERTTDNNNIEVASRKINQQTINGSCVEWNVQSDWICAIWS